MADVMKVTTALNLEAEFVDGDTRSITVDNPRSDVTEQEIDALNAIMVKCLLGDKTGAQFLRWKTAKVVRKQTVTFDLK